MDIRSYSPVELCSTYSSKLLGRSSRTLLDILVVAPRMQQSTSARHTRHSSEDVVAELLTPRDILTVAATAELSWSPSALILYITHLPTTKGNTVTEGQYITGFYRPNNQ